MSIADPEVNAHRSALSTAFNPANQFFSYISNKVCVSDPHSKNVLSLIPAQGTAALGDMSLGLSGSGYLPGLSVWSLHVHLD